MIQSVTGLKVRSSLGTVILLMAFLVGLVGTIACKGSTPTDPPTGTATGTPTDLPDDDVPDDDVPDESQATLDANGNAKTPTGDGDVSAPPMEADLPQDEDGTPESSAAVRIYFPSSSGDGLIAESRNIFLSKTTEDRIKQVVTHLLDGPGGSRAERATPGGTTLRQAYLTQKGVAYVDFSSELSRGLTGGSMQETLTVYAIVDSVALNFREVKSVGILVEGQPLETLNGHLDLRYPLRANRDLVLR